MERSKLETLKLAEFDVSGLVSKRVTFWAPPSIALHDKLHSVSLMTRFRRWSFSWIGSLAYCIGRQSDRLVTSKQIEGPDARNPVLFLIICVAAFAVAMPAIASETNAVSEQVHNIAFTATGLPPGISIDPKTGVISGAVDREAITDGKMSYDARIFFHDVSGVKGSYTVNIALPNAQPVAQDDVLITKIGTQSSIPVLTNDKDGDGDRLVILWAKSEQSNPVKVDGDTLKFDAVSSDAAQDIITYAVSDGHGGTATARVSVSTVK